MLFNNTLRLSITIGLLIGLCGCSVTHRIVHEDHEGEVPSALFKEVKNKHTEKKWVTRSFGQPKTWMQVGEQVETATYHYKYADYQKISVLFFFNFDTVERKEEYAHFVFKEKVVVKHWIDEFPNIQKRRYKKYLK